MMDLSPRRALRSSLSPQGRTSWAGRLRVPPVLLLAALALACLGDAALFSGAVSLWQIPTADGGRGGADIPALRVQDAPRFGWRGLLLDSARHFQSPAFVEQLIDRMARAKLNVLQWHLTDDQGWR